MNIGIIGCGNISRAYFNGAKNTDLLTIKACADMRLEAAKERAEQYGVEALSVEELLADPEIELVVNLTIPRAHVEVGLQCLEAGKHTYSEKPFGVDIESGKRLVDKGRETGLRVGCAPDTFLGAGVQTSRKAVDEGAIGRPIAGTAFMCGHGHESWHPNPAFYYDLGGGPMLDMGPYYVTALVNILGPVKRVAAVTTKAFNERLATSDGAKGQVLPVHVTTHLAGTIEFVNGCIVTMIMSFDMWRHALPCIELYGTEGSIKVPDPNGFGGDVRVAKSRGEWESVELAFPNNARMIGVIDMVQAIKSGRPHRVSGDLAYHVLEVMTAFDRSSESGEHIVMQSTVARPAAMPTGLAEWAVEA
ncbi:MAG: Gfo/Idh/MocA family oxidoreductase [Candidatus Poribacteria bacterium]|nr:Gfo/Idh/MocA family oxidoreductase [Candidatus Poribacteria bacterium]